MNDTALTHPTFHFALREDIKNEIHLLPAQGEPIATGYDCRSAQQDRKPIILRPGMYCKIPLGFRMFAPKGWWVQLNPRSSTFVKKQIHALYGVVDEGYENEMFFCGQYIPDVSSLGTDLIINFGDALGQLIPVRRETMQVTSVTNEELDRMYAERGGVRGTNGFGSTGG